MGTYVKCFMSSSNSLVDYTYEGVEYTRIVVDYTNTFLQKILDNLGWFSPDNINDEVIEWANKHIDGRWTCIAWRPDYKNENDKLMLFFENHDAAVAFKLMWL